MSDPFGRVDRERGHHARVSSVLPRITNGTLADPCMVFDSNGEAVSYQTHWQESREGSMGGFGVQGGGCGCK